MARMVEPRSTQVEALFRRVARQGAEVAGQIEKGQAETPLGDHFAALEEALDQEPLGLILIGSSKGARGNALQWLCGREFRVLTVGAHPQPGLIQIRLQEKGYSVERHDGRRLDFESLPPFLEALASQDLVRNGTEEGWADPLCLRVAGREGATGLVVSMPERLDLLRESPAVLGRLAQTASLLALAVDDSAPAPAEDRQVVADLCESVEAVLPLLIETNAPPQREAWWKDRANLGAAQLLPPIQLGPDGDGPLPALLTERRDGVGLALRASRLARRMQSAVDLVAARHEGELRQHATRQQAAVRRAKTVEEAGRERETRQDLDAAKQAIQEELAQLAQTLSENNRRALLPTGTMLSRLKQIVDGLGPEDLAQLPGPRTVKLELGPEFAARIHHEVRRALRDQLHEDLELLHRGFENLRTSLERRLAEACGAAPALELRPVDAEEMKRVLAEMISMELGYKGELPRRTLFQRIGEGRRPLYMLMMLFSLGGGAIGLRVLRRSALFGAGMLLLFVVGFGYTFVTWRREDEDRLAKEADRAREAVWNEVRRLVAEIQREKLSRLSAHLATAARDALKRTDTAARDAADARSRASEQERRELRARLKNLEQRGRDLQLVGQQVARLRQGCAELQTAVRPLLGAALREAKA